MSGGITFAEVAGLSAFGADLDGLSAGVLNVNTVAGRKIRHLSFLDNPRLQEYIGDQLHLGSGRFRLIDNKDW